MPHDQHCASRLQPGQVVSHGWLRCRHPLLCVQPPRSSLQRPRALARRLQRTSPSLQRGTSQLGPSRLCLWATPGMAQTAPSTWVRHRFSDPCIPSLRRDDAHEYVELYTLCCRALHKPSNVPEGRVPWWCVSAKLTSSVSSSQQLVPLAKGLTRDTCRLWLGFCWTVCRPRDLLTLQGD